MAGKNVADQVHFEKSEAHGTRGMNFWEGQFGTLDNARHFTTRPKTCEVLIHVTVYMYDKKGFISSYYFQVQFV